MRSLSRLCAIPSLILVVSCSETSGPLDIQPQVHAAPQARADARGQYTAIDLGTLPGGYVSQAWSVNTRGMVVGASWGDEGARPFAWTEKDGMVNLGSFGSVGWALDVNDRGQVVGQGNDASGNGRAFLWTRETGLLDLGTLGGTTASAWGINNRGQVVGGSETATGESHAFIWAKGAGMQDLGSLGGNFSWAYDISESGVVVGHSSVSAGDMRAFAWRAQTGVMENLGISAGVGSTAMGINNRGEIVGYYVTQSGASLDRVAFLLRRDATYVDLGTLGGIESAAHAVTDDGRVFGWSTDASGRGRAFLWTEADGMIDLGTLGGDHAAADDATQRYVAGVSSPPGGSSRATLWLRQRAQ